MAWLGSRTQTQKQKQTARHMRPRCGSIFCSLMAEKESFKERGKTSKKPLDLLGHETRMRCFRALDRIQPSEKA